MSWLISFTIMIAVIWTKPDDMIMWFIVCGLFAIAGSIEILAGKIKINVVVEKENEYSRK